MVGRRATYQDLENIDLIDKSRIVFHFFLLNSLDSILLMAFSMFSQIDDAKAAIRELLLERVDLFDVTLCRVNKVLGLCRCI